MVRDASRTVGRLERWVIVGDGLSYTIAIVPDNDPLTQQEILSTCHCDAAVISIFDALSGEFIGMAYAGRNTSGVEVVNYGRRKEDKNPYSF